MLKPMEKIKLSKERIALIAQLKDGSLTGMAKVKASKRVVELVVLLGGGESKERSEYPFGKLDGSDSYQFNGYRVRVLPGAGGLGDPWEGEVVNLRNHGRLVEVRKDGMAPGSLSIRVSGDRIVVLSAPKGHESTVNGSAPKPVDAPSQQQEAKPYTPEPYAGPRDVSSRAGQMELAQRAGTIASLKAMNSQLRQIAPSEAWDDRAIEEADDLDSVRDMISNALVAAARSAHEDSASQADQYKKIAHYFAVNYQALKGERRERFIEEIIPDLDAIIRGLELIKADSIQELNDFKQGKIKPSKIVGSGHINPKSIARNWLEEKVANDEAILQAAIQLQNAQNTATNPLYQSVIDGAEINISLIERVIEEVNKNGDDETHGQLVQAVDVIKAWAREQGMPDEAFDSLFDSLYNGSIKPFYYTERMSLIDGL